MKQSRQELFLCCPVTAHCSRCSCWTSWTLTYRYTQTPDSDFILTLGLLLSYLPTYTHLLTRPGFHSYLSQTHLLPISPTSLCTNSTQASSQTHLLPISLTSLCTNSTHASSQSHLLLPISLTSLCTPHSRQLHSSAATQTPQIPHADTKTLGQSSSI